jgi:hypothetical protein
MKKTLLTLLLVSNALFFVHNNLSKEIRRINPKKVKSIEIFQSRESYNERVKKIKSIQYNNYKDMLSEVKDVRDAEIYCTKILVKDPNPLIETDKLVYGEEDYWASFKESFTNRLGDCDDGAIAAAALLYDNGFHPYFLRLCGRKEDHLVFLYKNKEGRFGTVGINPQDCQESKDINDLINKFNRNYPEQGIFTYDILDGERIFPDAIDKEGNYKRFL